MSSPAPSRSTEAASRPEIVVVGGIATDCMARAPKLPAPGSTVLGDRFGESPGGKGANQALAARRLGGRVALIGRAGADARGDIALARLNGEGVDARYVVRDDSAATGVVLIQLDQDGTTQMLAVRGANDRLAVSDLEAAAELFAAPRAVLVQLEIPSPSSRGRSSSVATPARA